MRMKNNWELPDTRLTSCLTGQLGFADCWSASQVRSGPVATSRFGTRVDYVFANRPMLDQWSCTSLSHVEAKCSDHRMVVAVFEKKTSD